MKGTVPTSRMTSGHAESVASLPAVSLLFSGRLRRGPLLNRKVNGSQHLIPGSGLPCPYLKLPRSLMNKHFNSRDNLRTSCPSQLHESRFSRIVDHFEHIARVNFLFA